MSLLDRYEQLATRLDARKLRRQKVLSSFVHPDVWELIDVERAEWPVRDRRLRSQEIPLAGLGFTAPLQPNTEPVNAPAATTATAETNLYNLSGTNSPWCVIPAGTLRSPMSLRVIAAGIVTTSSTGTEKMTTRIGTSSTVATNVSLGATGAIALGSAITNALWFYEANATVLTMGTGGTMTAHSIIDCSLQAAGSVTSTNTAIAGNTTGTIDMTLQQAWSITHTGGNSGVSCQLTQFALIAID